MTRVEIGREAEERPDNLYFYLGCVKVPEDQDIFPVLLNGRFDDPDCLIGNAMDFQRDETGILSMDISLYDKFGFLGDGLVDYSFYITDAEVDPAVESFKNYVHGSQNYSARIVRSGTLRAVCAFLKTGIPYPKEN